VIVNAPNIPTVVQFVQNNLLVVGVQIQSMVTELHVNLELLLAPLVDLAANGIGCLQNVLSLLLKDLENNRSGVNSICVTCSIIHK